MELLILLQPTVDDRTVVSVLATCHFSDWLDTKYRLSICNTFDGLVVDIRQFEQDLDGVKPTVTGISLNVTQWNQLLNISGAVNSHIGVYKRPE